ncbi:ParA family protein [Adlercreutzia equolifaciens]|uniref:ParA family protein n=1 Tax=Adlercreutzia equolifaciens TaxID=446660 RepID=UPI003AF16E74
MGFFDGLKRDTKQARTVEEVDRPQTQEQEVVVAEEELVDDLENIEVVVREVEDCAAPVIPQEPLKSYKDKAPVRHVVGQTKIIAIINQKGGVGKSTTAINLGAALGEMGKQVLLVDLDPQGNCSSGLGVEKSLIQQCIYDVLLNDVPLEEVIIPDIAEGLDIAPATINLAGAEVELVSEMARENRLKDAVGGMRGKYDFILIDCPPSLGLLTVNALVAADKLLIPIQCEFYALEGVTKLLESMKRVKSRLNPTLDIYGILLTMYDSRTTLSKQVVDEVREYFGRLVFTTPIPRTVKLSEAPSFGQPITQYDPKGRGALSYIELAKEVIARG